MKKNNVKLLPRLISSLLVFLCGIQALPSVAQATNTDSQKKVLNVAFPIVKGISEYDENGERAGIVVDYLNEISNYTGWSYNYIDIVNISEMDTQFQNGDYDLMGGQYYFEGAANLYSYPNFHTGYSKIVLLAKWEDESLKTYDLASFNGKSIGVYANAKDNIKRLKHFLNINELDCTIREYSYDDIKVDGTLYRFLENGEIDMLLGNITEAGIAYKAVASFDSKPFYIVCQPSAPEILEGLNMALEHIYQADPNFHITTYNSNFSDVTSLNISLNSQEKAFISDENNIVRIAVPDNIHPIYCLNDTNENWHNGILYDIMKKISKKTGLKYTFVSAENFGKSYSLVKNNDADVAGIFLDSIESANDKELAITKSYATVNMTLIKNKKVTYPSEGLKIGIIEGRTLPENIDATQVVFQNINDLISAVNKRTVDLGYGISSLIEKTIQENMYPNIVSISLQDSIVDARFAVNKPASSPIFTILNKGISMITPEEMEGILIKNVGSIGGNYSLLNFIYSNPIEFASLVSVVLIIIIIIVVILFSYRIKSSKMKIVLDKTNAENQAKSAFLSRMSHEIRTPMNAISGLTNLILMKEDITPEIKTSLNKINSSSNYLLSLLNDILDMSRLESGMMNIVKVPFSICETADEIQNMLNSESLKKGVEFNIYNTLSHDIYEGDSIRIKQVLTNLIANAIKFTPANGSVSLMIDENEDESILFSVKDTGKGISNDDIHKIFDTFVQVGDNVSNSKGTGLGLSISKSFVGLMGGELKVKSVIDQGSDFYFSLPLKKLDKLENKESTAKLEMIQELNILLVEDNDLNAEIAQSILEMTGSIVYRVNNGQEAVEEFQNNFDKYDVIFMDIQMPVMNGLDATKAIRKLDIPKAKTIQIIAMTANSFQEDSDAAINAGMNYFITKPIDIKLLNSVLANIKK